MKKLILLSLFSFVSLMSFATGHIVNTFVINNTTCSNDNGSIRATVSGGVGPFTYSWNTAPVQTNDTAFFVFSGTYTVTVTDQNDMSTSTGVITVTDSPAPTILVSGQNVVCENQFVNFVTSTTGGTAPFVYSWTGPGGFTSNVPNPTINNVFVFFSGTFTVTVTDANGCVGTDFWFLQVNPMPMIGLSPQGVSCFGSCDGSIISTVNPPAIQYNWSCPISNTTANLFNACAGVYTLTAVDMNGCMGTSTAVINQPVSLTSVVFPTPPTSCNACDGYASIVTSGGTPPYSFAWNTGSTLQNLSGLCPGFYDVSIVDANGCSDSAGAYLNASATCGNANGFIVVSGNGPNPPFQYSLNGSPFSTNTTYPNLIPGTYTVVAKDALGCMNATQTVVTSSNGEMAYFSTGNSTCTNNNGTSSAYAFNVTGPYTYLWQPGGETTQTILNLAPGTYTCTITGNAGCAVTGTTTVTQQNNFYLAYDYDYYNCGTNSLTANASFGQAPYTYAWQPGGQTTATITNQNAGNYICTVTDATGCTAIGTYGIYTNNSNMISGVVYNDVNSNCAYDAGDSLLPYWSISANSGANGGWAWTSNGSYQMYLPNVAATYSVTATPTGGVYGNNSNYDQFNCAPVSAVLNAACDTVMDVNIPVTVIPAQDLAIYNYCGTSRPGFYVSNSIGYSNVGTLSTSNVIVTYDLDPLLTYIGSTPAATTVSGNHLEFNLGTLAPGQTGWIYVNAIVPTIQNGGALGTLINNSAAISIVGGEQTPSDNVDACTTAITGSYDPNEKEVYAENMSPSGAIDITGRKMYYTVHFQNTGTDTAFTITVRDTISNLLDLNSLELLTASHAYTARILQDRTLELTFNNILLVDSNKNEPLSHGYFNYAIHTKPGLQNGDNIANTAAIYFDFNLPIITNTVNTPVQTSVGIKETSNSLMASVFPNPLSNGDLNIKFNAALSKNVMMRIYGVGGNEVFTKQLSNNNQQSVNVAGLSAGIYFVRLNDEAGRSSDIKLVITKYEMKESVR
ncbi:MAG: T9SS type A sorting domain-containing protein [Bacteroidetes bacterium]|nr:T9SS type A sorting domain-containing protein [Bacteroidota bacterium]